jgi:hypothetical protein
LRFILLYTKFTPFGTDSKNKVITVHGKVLVRTGDVIKLETKLKTILPGQASNVTDMVDVHFRNPSDADRARGNISVRGRCEGFNNVFDVVIRDAELVEGVTPGSKDQPREKGPDGPID